MDAVRLELLLMKIARKYAPSLVPPGWRGAGDYARLTSGRDLTALARALAGFNALVMIGDLDNNLVHQSAVYLKDWVDQYTRLYHLLTDALFPTFRQVSALYVDQGIPRTVAIIGAATPVIVTMAELIVPYITERQTKFGANDAELVIMMDIALDQLEAGDLPPDAAKRLRGEGALILKQVLQGYVYQAPLIPLTIPISDIQMRPELDDTGLISSSEMTPIETTPLDAFTPTVTSFDVAILTGSNPTPPFSPAFQEPPSLPELPEIETMGDSTGYSKPFTIPLDPPDMPESLPETPTESDTPYDPDSVPIFYNPKKKKEQ